MVDRLNADALNTTIPENTKLDDWEGPGEVPYVRGDEHDAPFVTPCYVLQRSTTVPNDVQRGIALRTAVIGVRATKAEHEAWDASTRSFSFRVDRSAMQRVCPRRRRSPPSPDETQGDEETFHVGTASSD